MEIGRKVYLSDRDAWRKWLSDHHDTEKEIWLVYYRKNSGKPSLPYNDAVDEALCFGWIDSTVKKIDDESYAQRFTPRRPGSPLSAMNAERVRRLIEKEMMTPAGLAAIGKLPEDDLSIAPDILNVLQSDSEVWQNFQNFPESYKRIRIGWIEGARDRPDEFQKRLRYFLRMTKKNKKYGMML